MGSIDLINGRLSRITNNMEEQAGEIDQKLDTEAKKVISNINAFKSSVAVKFSQIQMGNCMDSN